MAEQGLCLHFFAKNEMACDLTMEDSVQSLGCLRVSITLSEEGKKQRSLRCVGDTFSGRELIIMCYIGYQPFPFFKWFHEFSYSFSLSSTLGDARAAVRILHFTYAGRTAQSLVGAPPQLVMGCAGAGPSPRLPLPPAAAGPSQHAVLSQNWRNWNIDLVGFAFFFFLLQILFWVCSLSIPSFPSSYSSLSLPPTPRLSELVSDAASPAALAANLPASQPAFGAHRLQSCVLRLPVASSQGWIKISF